MKIKAMGYPAKNFHFSTEKEMENTSNGAEHKSIKGESGGTNSLKTMYGMSKKKLSSKRKM